MGPYLLIAPKLLVAAQTGKLDVANLIAAAWSPRGTYLQTYERPSKEQGNAHKNLKVTLLRALRVISRVWRCHRRPEGWLVTLQCLVTLMQQRDQNSSFHLSSMVGSDTIAS